MARHSEVMLPSWRVTDTVKRVFFRVPPTSSPACTGGVCLLASLDRWSCNDPWNCNGYTHLPSLNKLSSVVSLARPTCMGSEIFSEGDDTNLADSEEGKIEGM